MLLEKGADPRARKSDGTTPLHLAASREEVEVGRILLAHGADVEAKDDYGRTAFDVASERGCDEIMKLLSERDGQSHGDVSRHRMRWPVFTT